MNEMCLSSLDIYSTLKKDRISKIVKTRHFGLSTIYKGIESKPVIYVCIMHRGHLYFSAVPQNLISVSGEKGSFVRVLRMKWILH